MRNAPFVLHQFNIATLISGFVAFRFISRFIQSTLELNCPIEPIPVYRSQQQIKTNQNHADFAKLIRGKLSIKSTFSSLILLKLFIRSTVKHKRQNYKSLNHGYHCIGDWLFFLLASHLDILAQFGKMTWNSSSHKIGPFDAVFSPLTAKA